MSEGPLLLSGAKSGVLIEPRRPLRARDVALGVIVALFAVVGASNIVFGAITPAPLSNETGAVSSSSTSSVSSVSPERLRIPEIGIDALIEHVGLNPRGNMAVPSTYGTVAWYKDGTTPGDVGNAVIAGHLDNSLGLSGIFENLNRLRIGDRIEIVGENGERITFGIISMNVYKSAAAPADEIFGGDGTSRNLVLITCNGAWDDGVKSYDKRLVVIAERI